MFLGYYAGCNKTTGDYNIALGKSALQGTSGSATGEQNIALGTLAFECVTTGSKNVIMGYQAGHGKQTSAPFNQAAENIILGYQAGYLIENGTTNIIIGYWRFFPASLCIKFS